MPNVLKTLPPDAVWAEVESPVGILTLIASDKGLHFVLWANDRKDKECRTVLKKLKADDKHRVIVRAKKQLAEYFSKRRKTFDLPLVIVGTDFQKKVWKELLKIPYGKTISYGEQAKRVGDAKKARAVGAANGKNPVSIVVPCHRVIGKNGALTGFGGGMNNKKILLELEQEIH